MNTNEKSKVKWEKDLWKSFVEQDIMQLRNKLIKIQGLTENQLKSYSINSTEDADYVQ